MSDFIETAQAEAHDKFISDMAAKYGGEDDANVDAGDGIEAGDEVDEGTEGSSAASGTDDEGGAEHTATGTSDEPDGATSESGEESVKDDDDEHPDGNPDGDTPTDSAAGDTPAEGGEAEAKKEGEEDPETAIAEDTKALLAAKGADLKLEDVPDEYRPLIEKKLRGIDQAFSRQSAENTAWRAERAQINAERQFQKDHPELLIADLLRKHPELEGKVLEASPEPDDEASLSAFDKKVSDARDAAKQAAETYEQQYAAAVVRANDTVEMATRLAKDAGFEYAAVEPHLLLAYQQKPDGPDKWLTEEETANVIARFSRMMKKPVRQQLREQSKKQVQARTQRRVATAVPARAAAAPSRPATPAPKKETPINWNDEESRQARMMESARLIVPGRK